MLGETMQNDDEKKKKKGASRWLMEERDAPSALLFGCSRLTLMRCFALAASVKALGRTDCFFFCASSSQTWARSCQVCPPPAPPPLYDF